MATIKLPLEKRIISIGHNREYGPRPKSDQAPEQLDFAALDGKTLRRIQPDEVVSWLFCDAYDAYDVAQILVMSGFRGRYAAVAPDLPNPKAVAQEIRRCFPGLDFTLFCPSTLSQKVAAYYDFVTSAKGDAVLAPA